MDHKHSRWHYYVLHRRMLWSRHACEVRAMHIFGCSCRWSFHVVIWLCSVGSTSCNAGNLHFFKGDRNQCTATSHRPVVRVDTYRRSAARSIGEPWGSLAIIALPTEVQGEGSVSVPMAPRPAAPARRAESVIVRDNDAKIAAAKCRLMGYGIATVEIGRGARV